MNCKLRLLALFVLIINKSWAQPSYSVTDTQPVVINGLNIGYNIKSQEVKTVGDKGDFSRYAIRFYVTNMANAPIIMPYREGWNQPGNTFDLLARFDVLNATGARLTSKTALIRALPYKTMTLVEEKDPHTNKIVKVSRPVQVGFFMQAGQTISVDEIVIVPLNQLPNVQAVCFTTPPPPGAVVTYAPNPGVVQNPGPPVVNMQGFLKLKNVFNNTFINIQTGVPASTAINNGWWSAQWELTPIAGTNYFNIKNRWKGNFIDTDRGYVIISFNSRSASCMWSMEPTRDPNIFRIKNAQTNGFLSIANNNLVIANNANNDFRSAWQLEQP